MTWFKRAIVTIQPDTRPSTTYQLPLQCLGGLLAWGRLGEVVRDEEEELCRENQGAQCNPVRLKAPVTVLARRDTHPGGRKCCYCGGPSLTSVFISSWRLHPLHRPPVRPDPGLFTRSPPRRAELSSSAGAGIRKDEKRGWRQNPFDSEQHTPAAASSLLSVHSAYDAAERGTRVTPRISCPLARLRAWLCPACSLPLSLTREIGTSRCPITVRQLCLPKSAAAAVDSVYPSLPLSSCSPKARQSLHRFMRHHPPALLPTSLSSSPTCPPNHAAIFTSK
jgi:hypothetical protein